MGMTVECMEVQRKIMVCKRMIPGSKIKETIFLLIQKVFPHFLTDWMRKVLEKIRKITQSNCRIYFSKISNQ